MRSRFVAVAVVVGVVAMSIVLGGPVARARSTVKVPSRLRVLVVGESQAGTLAIGSPRPPTPHGLVAEPGLILWDRTILGCSISSVPTFILADGQQAANQCGGTGRWQQQWAADVQATRPDVVFVMAGARDLFDVAGADGTVVHPGDPAWTERYTADVRELFRILAATGAPVVAVKPTCYGPNTLPDGEAQESERLDPVRVQAVTAAWEAAASADHLRLLDVDAVTCPGGTADPVVRADGVHFTVAGADRLAPIVTSALRRAVTAARARTGSAPRLRSDPARRG
jgi:lysophospholipase L1-like esterase